MGDLNFKDIFAHQLDFSLAFRFSRFSLSPILQNPLDLPKSSVFRTWSNFQQKAFNYTAYLKFKMNSCHRAYNILQNHFFHPTSSFSMYSLYYMKYNFELILRFTYARSAYTKYNCLWIDCTSAHKKLPLRINFKLCITKSEYNNEKSSRTNQKSFCEVAFELYWNGCVTMLHWIHLWFRKWRIFRNISWATADLYDFWSPLRRTGENSAQSPCSHACLASSLGTSSSRLMFASTEPSWPSCSISNVLINLVLFIGLGWIIFEGLDDFLSFLLMFWWLRNFVCVCWPVGSPVSLVLCSKSTWNEAFPRKQQHFQFSVRISEKFFEQTPHL